MPFRTHPTSVSMPKRLVFCLLFALPSPGWAAKFDNDTEGRAYARETFGEVFPEELSKAGCQESKNEIFSNLSAAIGDFVDSIDTMSVDSYFLFESYYQRSKAELDLCIKYIRMTKQGNLVEPPAGRRALETAFHNADWALVPVRIAYNEGHKIDSDSLATTRLVGNLEILRRVMLSGDH